VNDLVEQTSPASRRLAAIDVGTNSIRLVVAEVTPDRSSRIIDDEKVVARLGRGLSMTGRLDEVAMHDAAQAVTHLATIAGGFGATRIRAVATCAVREAANGADFLELVRDMAGVELDIVSAEDEARLAFVSVANAFDLRGMDVAVMDVGGGSTEIVLCSDELVERIGTLEVGAVRLSEELQLGAEPVPDAAYRALKQRIDRELHRRLGKMPFRPQLLIGTGGTFTNLAAMSMHRGTKGRSDDTLPFNVRGYELQYSEVKHLLELLRKMPLRERSGVAGLNPDRADIIVAGMAIIDRTMKHLRVNRLRVHDGGIRAGLLHEMVAEEFPDLTMTGSQHVDRLRSVLHFAATCRHDQQHAEHVAALALSIFDALARCPDLVSSSWATEPNRELLHSAALLHDVGYLINYAKHHKHSYHLIMHSDLCGFTRTELEIIANIARYHRGARPKAKHAGFARLDRDDRELVRRLAAILRLAVGLDRSHAQRVRGVDVVCVDGMAIFEIRAAEQPHVELWGAERKSRLFEQTFGIRPRFQWVATERARIGPSRSRHVG